MAFQAFTRCVGGTPRPDRAGQDNLGAVERDMPRRPGAVLTLWKPSRDGTAIPRHGPWVSRA